ncbi:MAG: hypothetical protein KDJ15_02290 [Alphaproteobacteria bacterium]|nr:hypothetical protein [Alphaproteobacteria bacterium]
MAAASSESVVAPNEEMAEVIVRLQSGGYDTKILEELATKGFLHFVLIDPRTSDKPPEGGTAPTDLWGKLGALFRRASEDTGLAPSQAQRPPAAEDTVPKWLAEKAPEDSRYGTMSTSQPSLPDVTFVAFRDIGKAIFFEQSMKEMNLRTSNILSFEPDKTRKDMMKRTGYGVDNKGLGLHIKS